MTATASAWVAVVGTLAGVTLGHGLTWWRNDRDRKRIRRGHLEALKAEIVYCSSLAATYVRARIAAPSYRLPVTVYEKSFPELLTQGVFSEMDADAVIEFYVNVKAINSGLDYAQASIDNLEALMREMVRVSSRANLLVSSATPPYKTRFDLAIAAVTRHLPRAEVKRPEIHKSEEQ